MAGVAAMASVKEDFDTQPCKKSRKDGGSSVVITNYFSPVPKPVEKPFSPPRSNNIMDYFSRKTPPLKEKTSPPQQSKENCQKSQPAEKQTKSEMGKRLPAKRKKKSKAPKSLVSEAVTLTDETSCMIIEETHGNKNSTADVVSGTLGSDTAVQLSKLNAVTCDSDISDITDAKSVSDEQNEEELPPEGDSKWENIVKQVTVPNTTELSPTVPSKTTIKQVKTAAQNTRKRQQKETKCPEPEKKEAEGFLCDDSKEVSVDEAPRLSSNTVTISFEDFLRSQNKMEVDIKDDKAKDYDDESSTEVEGLNPEHVDDPKPKDDVSFVVPSVQISPRTVTIQAEVHAVSPKQEAVRAVGKVASIFTKRKGSSGPTETVSSPHVKDEHQSPTLTVKQKSNVVLQEEDLELAVIESESTPKCSEAERKQFMSAFKQPSQTKPAKSQGKQKQGKEKTVEAGDQTTEDDVIVSSDDQVYQDNKETKIKTIKRGRGKFKDEKETVTDSSAGTAVEERLVTVVETEDKKEDPFVIVIPSGPALRRSRREAVLRQAPETTTASPVRKTRRQKESKEAKAAVLPEDSPVNMSSPKTRRSKHGVFVAQIVCPPNAKESPIRIKFSRVHKNSTSKAESGSDKTALTSKMSNESKKRKQAKKLVEKAKMIQQGKKTCVEKETLRRSSRVKTSIKRSYCEDEDFLICVEDLTATPQSSPEKRKTQKPLRSLNDVLGKANPAGKETKTIPGSKLASLSQEKLSRRVSAVVSIFDESSHEGSENSQDDEPFRARREFLKSGLPESFRKQIAKTAATKEAYSASSSSFQTVTHTTQPPGDCPLWSLPWPESSLLSHLKAIWSRTLNQHPSVSDSFCVKTVPACRKVCEKGSGWRPEFSESIRQLLMEEFETSNSHFPAQIFFTRFLKRRAEHQQQFTASVEPEAVTKDETCTPLPAESAGKKRKRCEDERESRMKMAKKEKSNNSAENTSKAEQQPPRRGRRSLRSRAKEEEEGMKEKHKPSPLRSGDDCVIVLDDSIVEEDIGRKDVVKEDLLWTDKYQPQLSSDIIDNTAAVKRLHSWLKEWKLRADREERQFQKDKKQEEGSNDSDWDCGDDSQDMEDMLCNTVLITGPTGVGKTAAVYACAQELGFKVFEVNASSQRSGRLILSQLKEATQSHQVDSQGVNAYKPTYFNSYGASSSSIKTGVSPRKVNSPRKVFSSPRKNPQSPSSAKKGGLAPTSLAKFFKMAQPTNTELAKTTKKEEKASLKKAIKGSESGDKTKDATVKSPSASSTKEKMSMEQNKSATSLILFEEVDVIFEDDSGFLSAIKTFMSTTKRPVILTTSDPAFSSMFDGSFEEIHFKTPSLLNVGSYLQLLCLAEDIRTNPSDVGSLLRLNGCDIRQSLLQLQFWTRSAGGRRSASTCQNAGLKPETEKTEEAADSSSILPPCDAGCTESKLGLLNVDPDKDIWELLRSQSLMEDVACWEILTDSRRRGVDLLYSNMETLLPLPLTQLTTSKLSKPVHRVLFSQDKHSVATSQLLADCSDVDSPVKVSKRMKKNRKQLYLPERDGLHSESDSEDEFLSLCKPLNNPQKEEVKESFVSETIKRKLLTVEERRKSLPVSQCLESLANFWDNMSYVDSSLCFHTDIHGVSAVIKDGMSDELRVEVDRGSWLTRGRVLEIQAAVEALSFQKCRTSVIEAWDKVQQLKGGLGKEAAAELTLPVAAHREGYSFIQEDLCCPELVQRRKEAMESLTFQVFGTLGNRQAFALDYLPTMRTICRSEQLKEQGRVKRRFLHYLDAVHLGLEKSTLQLLAEDFP